MTNTATKEKITSMEDKPTQDWYSNICEQYLRPQRLPGIQTYTAQRGLRSE